MKVRRALRITSDQFYTVLKFLLYRIISGVIFFSLVYVILRLGLDVIMNSAEFDAIKAIPGDFFRALTTGNVETLAGFNEGFQLALKNFGALLSEHMGSIVGSVIGVCAMYLLSRFVNGLALFTIGNIINDRMSVYARTKFPSAFFRNIGNAALYQVVYVPLSFLYDVASLAACYLFFFYTPSFLPSWGVLTVVIACASTITAIILLQALKLTLIFAWIPAMVEGKKSVFRALGESLSCRTGFARRFAGFVAAIYLVVVVNVIFAIATVGSGCFFTVPLSFIFLLVLQFVNYYELAGKKYFVDGGIVGGEVPESLE